MTSTTTPFRVVLYSHDSVGLGHVRRNLAIAHSLAEDLPQALGRSVTGLVVNGVGAPAGQLPSGFDEVRLPGVTKGASGYEPREIDVPMDHLVTLRGDLFTSTLRRFAPDLVIVDRHPFGVADELLPGLRRLRAENPGCRIVLGLREILDDPAKARREWTRERVAAVLELFDHIWVYGDRAVHDVVVSGEVPEALAHLVHYTGYLATGRAVFSFDGTPGAEHPPPFVLTMVGGGLDGVDLCRVAAQAPLPAGTQHLLVTGPQMAPEAHAEIAALAAPGTTVVSSIPDGLETIRRASAVVAMGGYNTVSEILSTTTPALIVPRTQPRVEQLIRATGLAAIGAVDTLPIEDLTPEDIGSWFAGAVTTTTDRSAMVLDGLGEVVALAADLCGTHHTEPAHVG